MSEAGMRKLAMGFAVGAANLVMSAEAGACDAPYINHADGPYMARLVREAVYIDLARVLNATPLLADARGMGPAGPETHSYTLEVIDSLKGNSTAYLQVRAADPIDTAIPEHCDADAARAMSMDEVDDLLEREAFAELECYGAVEFHDDYAAYRVLVENGHADWPLFHVTEDFPHDGPTWRMDGEVPDFDICSGAVSLEVGATYLVFRDENRDPIFGKGLNFQEISRSDDRWFEAVRFFLANPDADYLDTAIHPATLIGEFDSARIVEFCVDESGEDRRDINAYAVIEGGRPQALEDIDEVPLCEHPSRSLRIWHSDNAYLSGVAWLARHHIDPLPIRDGRVDLSGLPSQYRIEPIEVPLEDVISWLSEEAETE
jgi:hypothetical protein